ncbi:MAG: glutathione S-transferase family protein, partial [Hyphomicrobium sp.]
WMLWESSSWFPSCYVYLVEHCVKPLFDQPPDAKTLEAQDVQFHKLAGILDARLAKSRYLCGDTPTIADIAVAAPMHLHALQKLPLGPHRNLSRWMTDAIEPLPCWEKTYVGPGFTLTRS